MTYTFGLDTFGDRNGDAAGKALSHAQTIRNVAEEALALASLTLFLAMVAVWAEVLGVL